MNIIEIEGHPIITDYLTSNSLVFDCGACVGEFTNQLYNINPCEFICYEPDPRNFRRLKNRFKSNIQIHPYQLGIDKEKGEKGFFLGKYITASSFYKSHRGLSDTCKFVFVTTIEEEVSEFGEVDLLKMDLEGSEIDVIQSIPMNILSKIKQITVEFHPQSQIEGYTQEKIDICRNHLKKQFVEIEYTDKGNDGHHGLYLRKDIWNQRKSQ